MATTLFTGFPGFLGSELLPRVLGRSEDRRAVCLIQSKFADLAASRVADICDEYPELEGRIELAEGDITLPDLGLGDLGKLARDVREIYHLAAVYDLSVPRRVGQKVNVDGTRHLLDFAGECTDFQRFHHISTCYVSGRYAGIFTEDDLDKGQVFNNYYEETKFLSEIEVQARMRAGMPGSIYRPAIVVGDSQTGETQKYDGPYFVMRWVLKQPFVAVVPVVGDPTAVRVNLVPRDFVVDAIAYLSGLEASLGKVYQLADPEPLTVDEILDEVGRATGRALIKVPLIKDLAKLAIDKVPGVFPLMEIPSDAVDYFVHPTFYTCYNTLADLEETEIRVPPFSSYLGTLLAFMRRHPEIGSDAMV